MDHKNITWKLSDLLTENNLEQEKAEIRRLADHLSSYREHYTEKITPQIFRKILLEKEVLLIKLSNLGAYAHLSYAKKTNDPKAQAFVLQIEGLGAEISNKILFLSLLFKQFPEKHAQRLIKALPNYKHYLERVRQFKPNTLSEEVEKVINIKDITGTEALNAVYDTLTAEFTFDFFGKKFTQEELLKYVRGPDQKKREQAYELLITTYQKQKNVISIIYQNIVHDWKNEAKLRNYLSPISVRNKANDLADEDVELLLKVFQKNISVFQEYFKVKAKILGIKKLRRYDIYAPLEKKEKEYTFPEAKELVLTSFSPFQEFVNAAQLIIEDHLDSVIQPGKRGGAFCYGPHPRIKPYILMNFTGDIKSVQTLAHELGHGIHDTLASHNHYFHFKPALPIAETASTFAEILLIEYLKGKHPELKKALTLEQLDDAYATIARQFQFVLFEKEAHEAIKQGKTSEEIEKLYLQQLKKHFGNNVEVPDSFRYEYLYVSHFFHTPFYCYAYGFGLLLAFSLFSYYQKDKDFKRKILLILASGSNDAPKEILKKANITLDEAFWQSGFDYLRDLIDALKKSK